MLLAIDIGNTNITLGLWDGREWRLQWRLRTVPGKTSDEYGIYLKALLREVGAEQAIARVIISSVVPALNRTFAAMCRNYLRLEARLVQWDGDVGITVATANPAEVGADRIVNAVAAYHLYPGPSVVIDMGTATTFDAISAQGELLGVAIAPGMQLAVEALASRAAQLSKVALEAPPAAIGRTTVEAMQSGIVFGYIGLVEGLVRRMKTELNDPNVRVIGTGGLISLIAPHTDCIDQIEPWLTLIGLRLIADRWAELDLR
jgi:type III pantothenate kinase